MARSAARMRLLDAALTAAAEFGVEPFPEGLSAWCAQNGISRATAYRHRARIAQTGAWAPISRRPRSCPHQTPEPVRELVVAVRRSLPVWENGADQIRDQLTRTAAQEQWSALGWVVPSRATIHKIIRSAGLVTPAPGKRPRSSLRRFAYARPRDCYQVDATIIAAGRLVVFEVIDDATRVLVASLAWPCEDGPGAVAAMRRAFTDYGVPALVLADNGASFSTSRLSGASTAFTRLITGNGARLIHSSPYHPQTCGKVERAHKTFKKWLADQPAPADQGALQALCDQYQQWYNTSRRHSAHDQPPHHTTRKYEPRRSPATAPSTCAPAPSTSATPGPARS
jgi:putative transposase